MKRLILMRHGKSSWQEQGQTDHERPLKPRGVSAAKAIGQQLLRAHIQPERLCSSTAVRTRQTCTHLLEATGWQIEPELHRELYLAPPLAYLQIAEQSADQVETLMMIGHNPGLEDLVSSLASQHTAYPTAATSVFVGDLQSWRDVKHATWRLEHLWLPRELAANLG